MSIPRSQSNPETCHLCLRFHGVGGAYQVLTTPPESPDGSPRATGTGNAFGEESASDKSILLRQAKAGPSGAGISALGKRRIRRSAEGDASLC
jgi:hypothetical protein